MTETLGVKHWMDRDNSRPVAEALARIEAAGLLQYVEGHSKPGGLMPFSVRVLDPETGKSRFLCWATEIKEFATKHGVSDQG